MHFNPYVQCNKMKITHKLLGFYDFLVISLQNVQSPDFQGFVHQLMKFTISVGWVAVVGFVDVVDQIAAVVADHFVDFAVDRVDLNFVDHSVVADCVDSSFHFHPLFITFGKMPYE